MALLVHDDERLGASGNVAATTLGALTPQRPLNRYPEFKGSVAAVYTHPLENTPGSSGAHYGMDALTCKCSRSLCAFFRRSSLKAAAQT